MRASVIENIPKLHEIAFPVVCTDRQGCLIVEVDDENAKRIRLMFVPYQAVRITTVDCFMPPEEFDLPYRSVVEIIDSPWTKKLLFSSKEINETATFMEKAKHFLIPTEDDYIEVLAWDIKWISIEETKD